MKSQDGNGTNEVAQYLNVISPYSSCYQDVEKLRKDVISKLKTDELREWNFQQKQYEDSQDYKRSIVKACRDVGMAWAINQPQSIVKNIIHGWWCYMCFRLFTLKYKIMMKMKNLLLICLMLTLVVSNVFSQSDSNGATDDVTLVVSGDGANKEEATNVALRSAIEQVYGTFVSANTSIVNDELTKDEIVTISSGNIKSYEEIESLSTDNKTIVTLQATVSISKLVNYAKSKGASAEFAGSTFGMNMKMKELNRKNELAALDNLLVQVKAFLPSLFEREMVLAEPKLPDDDFERLNTLDYCTERFYRYAKGDAMVVKRKQETVRSQLAQWLKSNSYLVTMKITYTANDNTKQLLEYILKTLNAISLSSEDLGEYQKDGLKWSTYNFMKNNFYFRNSITDINAWNRNLVHAFYDYFTGFEIMDNLGNKSYFEGYDEKFKAMHDSDFSKFSDFIVWDQTGRHSYVLKGHGLLAPFFKLEDNLIGPYTYWNKNSQTSGNMNTYEYSMIPDDISKAYDSIGNLQYVSFQMETWPEMTIGFLIPANDIAKYSKFEIQDRR